MHIQYYGLSCVKLTTKPGGRGAQDVTIIINPFARTGDLVPPQLASASIIIASADTPVYYSDVAKTTQALKVTMPGEYAMYGVRIIGMQAISNAMSVPATIYMIESEGLKVAVVSAVDTPLSAQHFEELGDAHILIIDAGGANVFSGDQAADIVRKIEPAYTIPVHTALPKYKATKNLDNVNAFCEKIGTCPKERVQKVVIKGKDCEDGATKVVLMAP